MPIRQQRPFVQAFSIAAYQLVYGAINVNNAYMIIFFGKLLPDIVIWIYSTHYGNNTLSAETTGYKAQAADVLVPVFLTKAQITAQCRTVFITINNFNFNTQAC